MAHNPAIQRLARVSRRSSGPRGVPGGEVFDRAMEAIIFLDAHTGQVVDANAAACELYGHTREELIASARSGQSERVSFSLPELRAGKRQRFFAVEYRGDGAELFVEVKASLVRYRGRDLILTCRRDVTQETVVSGKLAVAADDWHLTVNSIEAAILLVDLSGRVIRANETAARMVGPPSTGLAERELTELSPHEPWLRASELVAFVSERGIGLSSQVEDPFSGSAWDVAATPATSASGERRVIVVMRDITLMTSLEASVRRSENMAEIGRLVSGVAHEVRNPLFTISATLDAFEKQVVSGATAPIQPYLMHLRDAIGRLSKLMEDLLELGKPPAVQVSAEPLANAVTQAVVEVLPLAGRKRVTIVNQVTSESAKVLMDTSRLTQAVANLLENAVHYSPPEESVFISVRRVQTDGQTWALCSIEDHGAGFSEVDLPRLFEPFFTKRKGGTGLGLSIVQRVVEHHGGRVLASNRPGGGACITIMLPHLTEGETE